jgi:serine/threonine protein kinase
MLWRLMRADARALGYRETEPPQIEKEESGEVVTAGHLLGWGSTSSVYECENHGNQVIKVTQKDRTVYQMLKEEADVLGHLLRHHLRHHAEGRRTFPEVKGKSTTHLRLEPRGGALASAFWTTSGEETLARAKAVLADVMTALKLAHEIRYVHSDVRSRNIVWVGADSKAVLIDWGAAMKDGTRLDIDRAGDCFCRPDWDLDSLKDGTLTLSWKSDVVSAIYVFAALALGRVIPPWRSGAHEKAGESEIQGEHIAAAREEWLNGQGAFGAWIIARVRAVVDASERSNELYDLSAAPAPERGAIESTALRELPTLGEGDGDSDDPDASDGPMMTPLDDTKFKMWADDIDKTISGKQ